MPYDQNLQLSSSTQGKFLVRFDSAVMDCDRGWLIRLSTAFRNIVLGDQYDQIGDLLYFGQLFKAQGNNYFAEIANTF